MRQKLKNPLSLKDLIPKVLGKNKESSSFVKDSDLEFLQHIWKELVGDTLEKKTRPIKLYRKRLLIEVSGSSWANEMEFLKPALLNKIREKCRTLVIDDIRFQITTRRSVSSGCMTSPDKSLG